MRDCSLFRRLLLPGYTVLHTRTCKVPVIASTLRTGYFSRVKSCLWVRSRIVGVWMFLLNWGCERWNRNSSRTSLTSSSSTSWSQGSSTLLSLFHNPHDLQLSCKKIIWIWLKHFQICRLLFIILDSNDMANKNYICKIVGKTFTKLQLWFPWIWANFIHSRKNILLAIRNKFILGA